MKYNIPGLQFIADKGRHWRLSGWAYPSISYFYELAEMYYLDPYDIIAAFDFGWDSVKKR